MNLDNPSQEPTNAPLDMNTAANAFIDHFTAPTEEKSAEALEAEALAELTKKQPDSEAEPPAEEVEADGDKITIEVDGKVVELTKAELAESYKNGLRQADYTQKTMAVAEARKTAEAETARTLQERHNYATNLQKVAVQLEGALEQQNQIDWDALISSDPVEAMKQQHLMQKRQAAYQETVNQLRTIEAQTQAEKAEELRAYRDAQQQELIAKLPAWKDPEKATAEAAAIKTFLKSSGYDDAAISGITDHRAVLLARDAMLYRQMMSKAQAAAKKVEALPQKVVRPGVTDSNKSDGRTAAMQRLSKSGSLNDAADAFKAFL